MRSVHRPMDAGMIQRQFYPCNLADAKSVRTTLKGALAESFRPMSVHYKCSARNLNSLQMKLSSTDWTLN